MYFYYIVFIILIIIILFFSIFKFFSKNNIIYESNDIKSIDCSMELEEEIPGKCYENGKKRFKVTSYTPNINNGKTCYQKYNSKYDIIEEPREGDIIEELNSECIPIDCKHEYEVVDCSNGRITKKVTKKIVEEVNGGICYEQVGDSFISGDPECAAVDCVLSDWENDGTCCRPGKQKQKRKLISQGKKGGKMCDENTLLTREIDCTDKLCPIDCKLSDWKDKTTCLRGTKKQERTIISQANETGKPCDALERDVNCVSNIFAFNLVNNSPNSKCISKNGSDPKYYSSNFKNINNEYDCARLCGDIGGYCRGFSHNKNKNICTTYYLDKDNFNSSPDTNSTGCYVKDPEILDEYKVDLNKPIFRLGYDERYKEVLYPCKYPNWGYTYEHPNVFKEFSKYFSGFFSAKNGLQCETAYDNIINKNPIKQNFYSTSNKYVVHPSSINDFSDTKSSLCYGKTSDNSIIPGWKKNNGNKYIEELNPYDKCIVSDRIQAIPVNVINY